MPTTSPSPSGAPWTSGAWTGGNVNTGGASAFGQWRGREVDVATAYPGYDTWQEMRDSSWTSGHFDGFEGDLVIGLPMVPDEEEGTLAEVAAGERDDIFRAVAEHLAEADRGDSYVRVGLEANGEWYAHGATADTADDFVGAYRRVVTVMREVSPDFRFVFDISCGVGLKGSSDRMDSFTRLYPGDDYVDVIGCDIYDFHSVKVRNEDEWKTSALNPPKGPGLADLVEFAREHGKPFAIPEWGIAGPGSDGSGDNPFFIRKMYDFFYDHREELAFEAYFNEPMDYMESSLNAPEQNPNSAMVYRDLWTRASG